MKMSRGAAPAELFYGQQLRGEMPGLRHSIDVEAAIKQRDTVRQEYLEKGNKKTSPMFKENDPVWVQNTATGLWDIRGTIVGIRDDKCSYFVRTDKGTKKLRNRRFLIRRIPEKPSSAADAVLSQEAEAVESESPPTAALRHSPQLATKRVRFKLRDEHTTYAIRTRVVSCVAKKKISLDGLARVVGDTSKHGRKQSKTGTRTNQQQHKDGTDADRVSHSHCSAVGSDRRCGGGPGNTRIHPPRETRMVYADMDRDKHEETLVRGIIRPNGVEKAKGILNRKGIRHPKGAGAVKSNNTGF